MTTPRNPFEKPKAKPGKGEVVLSLLPPDNQVLTTFEYQYPLKLISPDPHKIILQHSGQDEAPKGVPITTIFLLTYGGGLLAGDNIDLKITLQPRTRLALLTQGSTKIFKSSSEVSQQPSTTFTSPFLRNSTQSNATRQLLTVYLQPHSTLCYLPDPVQPHSTSIYTQYQTLLLPSYASASTSLLFLDWVSEGRSARGESWTLSSYTSRTEIREFDDTPATDSTDNGSNNGKGRLLIRDAMLLSGADLQFKTDGHGILGTLLIYGPVWQSLAEFFVNEFKALPRIGGKNWSTSATGSGTKTTAEEARQKKQKQEDADGLLWTAAQHRGFVVVKFGAKEIDGTRRWLNGMLRREASVEREMGHQALLCLK